MLYAVLTLEGPSCHGAENQSTLSQQVCAVKVARDGPLTAGLQLREPEFSGVLQKGGHQLWREVQSKLSYAVAYSPAGPAIGEPQPAPYRAPAHPPWHEGVCLFFRRKPWRRYPSGASFVGQEPGPLGLI